MKQRTRAQFLGTVCWSLLLLCCEDAPAPTPVFTYDQVPKAVPTASAKPPVVVPTVAPELDDVDFDRGEPQVLRDVLDRLPRIKQSVALAKAFPARVRPIIEKPVRVVLYSVDWLDDDGLDWLLAGAKTPRSDVYGHLELRPRHRKAVLSFLYEGASRIKDFGMKCDRPHHAFLYTRGKEQLAISVCFECGRLHVKGTHEVHASIRWLPSFRNYLRAHLLAAHIPDMSSDLRP